MSEQKYEITTREVVKSVRQMIKDKYFLSVANYNTLYFYTHDKIPVIALSEYSENRNSVGEAFLTLSNISDSYDVKINNSIYSDIILTLARYQDFVLPKTKSIPQVDITEAKNLFQANRYLGDREAALILIRYLIEHNCPKNVINRSFYLLDKDKKLRNIQNVRGIIEHDNRLVKYETPKGLTWFFVGDIGGRSFSVMGKQVQKLFDFVEQSYQKQQ